MVVRGICWWLLRGGVGLYALLLSSCGNSPNPVERLGTRPPKALHAVAQEETPLPAVPEPDPAAAEVKLGYRVEVVMKNLTCPTSVEFDADGNMYVAEGGYVRHGVTLPPRILRITPALRVQELTSPLVFQAPISDLLWHAGQLFIAHRGKISAIENEQIREIVDGLPSDGDYQNNQMCIGADGKLYFGQGTASNSGVVGNDNYELGWLRQSPEFHDQPAQDIKLVGQSFTSPNPLRAETKPAQTAAFHAFNHISTNGHVVRGSVKASGSVLRSNTDGSDLEVYAWGLRNPQGIACAADGKLFATENGFEPRGSRPIANDCDDLYELKQGAWYGWPDYASGLPVTDPQFQPTGAAPVQFILAEHPPLERPLLTFPSHASTAKILCIKNDAFVRRGMLIVASTSPLPSADGPAEQPTSNRVMLVDPVTGTIETIFGKKTPDDILQLIAEEHGITAGPRRPVDVVLSPEGNALYVVDYGSLVMTEKGPRPIPHSGVVWKITSNGKLAFDQPSPRLTLAQLLPAAAPNAHYRLPGFGGRPAPVLPPARRNFDN